MNEENLNEEELEQIDLEEQQFVPEDLDYESYEEPDNQTSFNNGYNKGRQLYNDYRRAKQTSENIQKVIEKSRQTKMVSETAKVASTGTAGGATAAGGAAASGAAAAGGATAAGGAAAGGAAAGGGALLATPVGWIILAVVLVLFFALIIFVVVIIVAACIEFGDGNYSGSNNNSIVSQNSAISLTRTNLTKEEFVNLCNKYAEKDTSHKSFYNQCGTIYDVSIENNFNPEMVVIRAIVEGFSPGASKNNYWGIGCYNGAGVNACISYNSFADGVRAFIKNVSQYKSVEEMMGKYAYIGNNWYNPGSSSDGGCYYFPYIKQYMSPMRIATVENACSSSNTCTGTMCLPTNDEDQEAYAKWQVSKMADTGKTVFGEVTSDTVSKEYASKDIPTSVDDLKNRYYFIFDISTYLRYEKNEQHLFGQCVWYAYHRAMDIVNSSDLSDAEKEKRIKSLMSHSDDGGKYVDAMDNKVFKKVTNINDIEAPAVISWKDNSYGHVGIIEKITENSDGTKTYYITEGWRKRDCSGLWCTHNNETDLWKVTKFNSTTLTSVSTYNNDTFAAAASLLG